MWLFVQLQVKRTTCSKEADLVHPVPHTNWYPWRRQQGTYSKHHIQGKRCDGKGQAPRVYPAEAVDENICYSSYVATVCKRKRLKFAKRTDGSVWETLAQRPKTAGICTLFKAYTAERTGKCIWDRLKGPCYLSRDNRGCKIRARKQNTDIGKYCSVNWTIKLWNQLPAEVIATFLCKTHIFRKRVRNVMKWEANAHWYGRVYSDRKFIAFCVV